MLFRSDATIIITDETGKVVSTQIVKLVSGDNAVVLADVVKLAEGTFTVSLTAATEVLTSKFMNWKL